MDDMRKENKKGERNQRKLKRKEGVKISKNIKMNKVKIRKK